MDRIWKTGLPSRDLHCPLNNLSGCSVVARIRCSTLSFLGDCPFLGHVRLQLQLITRRLGCITSSLVNNSSKFIPSCHNQLVLYSGWSGRNSPFQCGDRHLHVIWSYVNFVMTITTKPPSIENLDELLRMVADSIATHICHIF